MSVSRKPIVLHASHGGRRFVIEEDEAAGFYIYIFEGERCIRDYLQDTLEIAKECAREDFGVPEDAWHDAAPAA
jgi:hypothetical protein